MQIVCLGGLFAWGTMCKVPLFARLVSGPLVEFQMRPQIQRSVVPFCVIGPWEGVTKIYLHLSSGNYLGVVYTLETFGSMTQSQY